MVVLLALVPPVLAAALLVAEAALPGDLIAPLVSSWPVYAGLSAAALAAILVAAWGRRDSAALSSAWLFLFCGMMLLSLCELVELVGFQSDPWVSDVFETAAFFPLSDLIPGTWPRRCASSSWAAGARSFTRSSASR